MINVSESQDFILFNPNTGEQGIQQTLTNLLGKRNKDATRGTILGPFYLQAAQHAAITDPVRPLKIQVIKGERVIGEQVITWHKEDIQLQWSDDRTEQLVGHANVTLNLPVINPGTATTDPVQVSLQVTKLAGDDAVQLDGKKIVVGEKAMIDLSAAAIQLHTGDPAQLIHLNISSQGGYQASFSLQLLYGQVPMGKPKMLSWREDVQLSFDQAAVIELDKDTQQITLQAQNQGSEIADQSQLKIRVIKTAGAQAQINGQQLAIGSSYEEVALQSLPASSGLLDIFHLKIEPAAEDVVALQLQLLYKRQVIAEQQVKWYNQAVDLAFVNTEDVLLQGADRGFSYQIKNTGPVKASHKKIGLQVANHSNHAIILKRGIYSQTIAAHSQEILSPTAAVGDTDLGIGETTAQVDWVVELLSDRAAELVFTLKPVYHQQPTASNSQQNIVWKQAPRLKIQASGVVLKDLGNVLEANVKLRFTNDTGRDLLAEEIQALILDCQLPDGVTLTHQDISACGSSLGQLGVSGSMAAGATKDLNLTAMRTHNQDYPINQVQLLLPTSKAVITTPINLTWKAGRTFKILGSKVLIGMASLKFQVVSNQAIQPGEIKLAIQGMRAVCDIAKCLVLCVKQVYICLF